jgi:calpain-15
VKFRDQNKIQEENLYRRSVLIKHKRKADENIALKHVENLVSRLSLSHSQFNDETFPPSLLSIYINGHSFSKTTLDLLPDQQTNLFSNHTIQWLRPDQIKPPNWNENDKYQWTVFRNPKPNDVLQGALGDCWFITALSVLAEQPEYLMKVN